MNRAVLKARERCCAACPTPCAAYRAGEIKHALDESRCPLEPPRWVEWARINQVPHQTVGLGDVVAAVAQPVARAIDKLAGTNMENCGGCGQRKEKLNALVPDVTKPLGPCPPK